MFPSSKSVPIKTLVVIAGGLWDLNYPNFDYVNPQTLDYLSSSGDCYIKVFCRDVCCIRVVQHISVYKSMGFIRPNKSTYLNTFVIQLAQNVFR